MRPSLLRGGLLGHRVRLVAVLSGGLLVLYDGTGMFWSLDGDTWRPLSDGCHFPGFPETWDAKAPAALGGFCPPFLTALQEHGGLLQVQLGLMARGNLAGACWCAGQLTSR